MDSINTHQKILEEIGLNRNEVKVYLSLLNLGKATVSPIAKESKIHRANVYESLKKLLLEKGLITEINKENTKICMANNPKTLLNIVKEKELSLQQIMPQLIMRKNLSNKTTTTEVIEGITSFIGLLHNLIEYKEDILAFGIPKKAPEMMKYSINQFHNKRIEQKINMYHIYNENAKKRIKILNKMPKTMAKYLPAEFNSNVTTVVCGSEVIFVSWEEPVSSVRINSPSFAKAYRNYFSLLWKTAK